MKSAIIFSALFSVAMAADQLIIGLGSSYAAGPGLTKPIGQILADKLKAKNKINYKFENAAVSGSVLGDVAKSQAPKLAGTKPAAVYMVSGGNDLNYVRCLGKPTDAVCKKPITREEFKKRYTAALDAIIKGINHDTTVPIYLFTYPQAVGADSRCGATNNKECTLTPSQLKDVSDLYKNLVDGTVDAIRTWRTVNGNSKYRVNLIPMRHNSKTHHVGTTAAWVNGKTVPVHAKGVAWHPNDAGAQAMAQYIFADLTKK